MKPERVAPILLLLPAGLVGFKMWQQDAALHGPAGGSAVVEGTEITLSARIAARVATVAVHEGDSVKAGQILVTLDCADTEAILAEGRAKLEAARAQAAAAQAQAMAASRGAAASKAVAGGGKAQAAAIAAQRDAAARQAARVDAQREDIAGAQVDQAKTGADALSHQAEAAAATASASALQAQMTSSQADAAQAAADAANLAVQAGEASLKRAELLAQECVVTAPRDGLIQTLPWEVGELVPLGGALVKLVDITEVTATFYLPNAELAIAKPGIEATVEADAWPETTFKGTVRSVAPEAEFTPRNIQTRTDRDRLVYPIEIAIPNPEGKLRPGMPVQVMLPGTDR
jgi:HlyD family secretion protein